MKRIFAVALISIFLTVFMCPFCMTHTYVYAETVPDGYTQLSTREQLTDAFLAYCKSRDSEIDGVAEAVSAFTYKTLVNAAKAIGINLDDVQAQLYFYQEENIGLRYFLTQSGVAFFNDLFAYLIQEEGLEVGDSADITMYNGRFFVDADGIGCLVGTRDPNSGVTSPSASFYKYSHDDVRTLVGTSSATLTFHLTDSQTYSNTFYWYRSSDRQNITTDSSKWGGKNFIYAQYSNQWFNYGYPVVIYDTSRDTLYLAIQYRQYNGVYPNFSSPYSAIQANTLTTINATSERTEVKFISNQITNYYEGDTIINNEGDIINGGGGDQGDDWNPVLPDVPPAGSDPSGGNTINWPDLDLPDFGLSNFSLGDLRLKFPFSIPFDIVSILGVINAPAVAPVIQEDIPIRIDLMNVDYTIPINLDMSDSLYDNFAVLVRAVEFIGFCIGLIHLTIRLVKG